MRIGKACLSILWDFDMQFTLFQLLVRADTLFYTYSKCIFFVFSEIVLVLYLWGFMFIGK